MRFSRLPRVPLFIVGLLITLSLILPLQFAVISPGQGRDVLTSVITIKGAPTYKSSGKLLVLTVLATSPSSSLFGLDVIYSWIRGETIVLPRSVVYPPNQSAKDIEKESTADMKNSQDAAALAAFSFLGFESNQSKITTSINLADTGGPSGGLVFALGVVEKLTSEDILAGRIVAGTGTIDPMGNVGAIGGINEKLISADRAGASVFLFPVQNCASVHHIPQGLKLYSVATLTEAVAVLKNPASAKPHCTWQQIR